MHRMIAAVLIAILGLVSWVPAAPSANAAPPGHAAPPANAAPGPGKQPLPRAKRSAPPRVSAQAFQRPFVPGEVIVKFKPGAFRSQATGKRLPRSGAELVQIGPRQSVEAAVAALIKSGQVEYAQPNYIYEPAGLLPVTPPSGGELARLWGMAKIQAPEAWALFSQLREVIVAVIDTGVDHRHPDLAPVMWTNPGEIDGNGIDDDGNGYKDDVYGWDWANNDSSVFDPFDDDSHGTHVAGTIAAAANGMGVVGAAPNVKIMALKFISAGRGTTASAIQAIDYAASHGARVINASWGAPAQADDLALRDAIARSGAVFIAAAGNAGLNIDLPGNHFIPAGMSLPNLISVAAVDANDNLPSWSNYGSTKVHVAAPGDAIYSTYPPSTGTAPAAVQYDAGTYRTVTLGFRVESLVPEARKVLLENALAFFGLSPNQAPRILLVNDSMDGTKYNQAYVDALGSAGYTSVDIYNITDDEDSPAQQTLNQYQAVVWYTAADSGPDPTEVPNPPPALTYTDTANLTTYLSGGGRLLLTGTDFSDRIHTDSFFTQTLGATITPDLGSYYTRMEGIAGSAFLWNQYYQFTASSDGWSDVVSPTADRSGAREALRYSSVDYGGAYASINGTSMAAPHVSGIAAVLLGHKNLTPVETVTLIKESGTATGSLTTRTSTGKIANLYKSAATSVGSAAISASSQKPGAEAVYTVSFQTSPYGRVRPGDTFTITFPEGFSTASGSPASTTISLPVAAELAPAATASLTVSLPETLRNPAVPGTYLVSVSTTADPLPVSLPLRISTAEVGLDRASYAGVGAQDGQLRKAQVTVTAPGLNTDPASSQVTVVRLLSGADSAGISLTLLEAGADTSVFTGRFGFTLGPSDEGAGLLSVAGPTDAVRAAIDGVEAVAQWSAAGTRRFRISGRVLLNGHPLEELVIRLLDGTGAERATAAVAAGTEAGTADYELVFAETGSFTLAGTTSASALTAGLTLAYQGGGAGVVTIANGDGSYTDEHLIVPATATLVPAAPGADQTPPTVLSSTPDGTPGRYWEPATPIAITFSEPVRQTGEGSLDQIKLVRLHAGGAETEIPASATLSTATVSLSGYTLSYDAAYEVRIPAGVLEDFGVPANAAPAATFGFSTLPTGTATGDWPVCSETVTENCISGFQLNGGQPAPRYKVRTSAGDQGRLTVQIVDLTGADPGLIPAFDQVQIGLRYGSDATPLLLHGFGQAPGQAWSWNGATREVLLTLTPAAMARGVASYPGFWSVVLDPMTGADPSFRTFIPGGSVLAVGDQLSGPVYSPDSGTLSFTLGGPATLPSGSPNRTGFALFLPDSLLRFLWNIDPELGVARRLQVTSSAGSEIPVTLARVDAAGAAPAGWLLTADGVAPAPTVITIAPRSVQVGFDRPLYRGIGGETVGGLLRRNKAVVRLQDNGTYNVDPNRQERVQAVVSSTPDGGGIVVDLNETGTDSGIFDGYVGFVLAGPSGWDDLLDRVNVSDSATLTARVGTTLLGTARWEAADTVTYTLPLTIGYPSDLPPLTPTLTVYLTDSGLPASTFGLTVGQGSLDLVYSFPEGNLEAVVHAPGYYVSLGQFTRTGSVATVLTETDGTVWTDKATFVALTGTLTADLVSATPVLTSPAAGPRRDSQVPVAGTADPYADVSVRLGDLAPVAARANGSGGFSLAPLSGLSDGTYTLTTVAVDLAGNRSDTATLAFEIDTIAPWAPVPAPLNSEATALTGSAEPGALVSVHAGLSPLGQAQAAQSGSFSVPIVPQAPDTVLAVTAADAAGNVSATATITVSRALSRNADLSGLALSGINLGFQPATMTYQVTVANEIASVNVTATAVDARAAIVLNGSPVPNGSTVNVGLNLGQNTITVQVTAENTTVTKTYSVTVTRSQPVSTGGGGTGGGGTGGVGTGGGGGGGGGGGFIFIPPPAPDTTPPDPPQVLLTVYSESTKIEGVAEPESAVTVQIGEQVLASVTLPSTSSIFSIPIPKQKAGTVLRLTATDKAGNESEPALVTVQEAPDRTPPDPPILHPVTSADTVVRGTAEPGATLILRTEESVLGIVAVGEDGTFEVQIEPQRAGTSISATATDAAKNVSRSFSVRVSQAPDTAEPSGPPSAGMPTPELPILVSPFPEAPPPARPAETGARTVTASRTTADGRNELVVTLQEGTSVRDLPPVIRIDLAQSVGLVRPDTRTAELPVSTLRQLSGTGREIRIETGVAELRVPVEALASLPGASSTGIVRLSVSAAEDVPTPLQEGFSLSGPVLSLTAVSVDAGGRTSPISRFGQRLTLTVPFSRAENPAHLGVYRLNPELGTWEYRGGRVSVALGVVSAELAGFSQYAVMEFTRHFDDVPEGHWAKADIELMAARHVARGTSAAEFSPSGNVTRAQFAALLVRSLGLEAEEGLEATFADASSGDWYFASVETAARAGLITGADGRFRPNDLITRQEIAVMLGRALRLRGQGSAPDEQQTERILDSYDDGGEVSSWARSAVAGAIELRLIGGRTPTTVAPRANASRAEAVVLLKRLLQRIGEL